MTGVRPPQALHGGADHGAEFGRRQREEFARAARHEQRGRRIAGQPFQPPRAGRRVELAVRVEIGEWEGEHPAWDGGLQFLRRHGALFLSGEAAAIMHAIAQMKTGETMRGLLAVVFALCASAASAQDFPNRTIRMLVGFPAGGPSDVPARIIAEKLRVALGQPVIVENKTGAAGMIALNEMLAQPRDGHTLLLCSYIDAINPLLYKKVAYKLEDVAPVSLIQKAYYAFTIPTEYAGERPEGLHRARQERSPARSTTARSAQAR